MSFQLTDSCWAQEAEVAASQAEQIAWYEENRSGDDGKFLSECEEGDEEDQKEQLRGGRLTIRGG